MGLKTVILAFPELKFNFLKVVLMKLWLLFFVFLSFSSRLLAQNEFLNKTNSIAPIGNNLKSSKASISPFVLNSDTKTVSPSSILEKNTMQFTNTNNFVNPGDVYLKKLNQKEQGDDSKIFRKNQYLGDFKSNSAFVKISYRDFGEVDGDEIRVWVNDRIITSRIFLNGNYDVLDLGLEKGFNKIDFEALNQGSSGPNTAEFQVHDDKGILISANQWNLATGFKATLIIFKE